MGLSWRPPPKSGKRWIFQSIHWCVSHRQHEQGSHDHSWHGCTLSAAHLGQLESAQPQSTSKMRQLRWLRYVSTLAQLLAAMQVATQACIMQRGPPHAAPSSVLWHAPAESSPGSWLQVAGQGCSVPGHHQRLPGAALRELGRQQPGALHGCVPVAAAVGHASMLARAYERSTSSCSIERVCAAMLAPSKVPCRCSDAPAAPINMLSCVASPQYMLQRTSWPGHGHALTQDQHL